MSGNRKKTEELTSHTSPGLTVMGATEAIVPNADRRDLQRHLCPTVVML